MNDSFAILSGFDSSENSSHSQAFISAMNMNTSSETSTSSFIADTTAFNDWATTQEEVESGPELNYLWTLTGLLSRELYIKIRKILRLYVRTILSLLGMMTNIASLVVIIRDNPKKSSNVLLMALAFADLMYTISTLQIASNIYFYYDTSRSLGFYFSPSLNLFMYYMIACNLTLNNWGYLTSVTMPLMITGERLLAIFFPLKFTSILTTRRTVFLVFVVYTYTFAFSFPIFFEIVYINFANSSRMRLTPRGGISDNNPQYEFYSLFVHYLSGYTYLALVIIGTTVIGVKIRLISAQRKKLASGGGAGEKSSGGISRTTKTLLSVSILYCVSNILIAALEEIRADGRTYNDDLMNMIIDIVAIINSSCNFFIYIFFNKKFRSQLSFKKSRGSRMGMSTKQNTQ